MKECMKMKKEHYIRKTELVTSLDLMLYGNLFLKLEDNVDGWFLKNEKKFKKMSTLFKELRIKYEEKMIAEIFKGAIR